MKRSSNFIWVPKKECIELIKNSGMSRKELAKKLNKSKDTLDKWIYSSKLPFNAYSLLCELNINYLSKKINIIKYKQESLIKFQQSLDNK